MSRCERCGYERHTIMFRDGNDICQRCLHGEFNASLAEYCTPIDMRMAAAALRIPITRGAVTSMLNQIRSSLPPVDSVRAHD